MTASAYAWFRQPNGDKGHLFDIQTIHDNDTFRRSLCGNLQLKAGTFAQDTGGRPPCKECKRRQGPPDLREA